MPVAEMELAQRSKPSPTTLWHGEPCSARAFEPAQRLSPAEPQVPWKQCGTGWGDAQVRGWGREGGARSCLLDGYWGEGTSAGTQGEGPTFSREAQPVPGTLLSARAVLWQGRLQELGFPAGAGRMWVETPGRAGTDWRVCATAAGAGPHHCSHMKQPTPGSSPDGDFWCGATAESYTPAVGAASLHRKELLLPTSVATQKQPALPGTNLLPRKHFSGASTSCSFPHHCCFPSLS